MNPEQPVHENKTASPSESCFERFWSVFPKKVGRTAAEKAWKKIKRPSETVELIMAALAWQTGSQQWLKDNGAYIPHPANWLAAERWLDERPTQMQSRHSGFGFGQYNLGTKAELRPGNRVVFKTGWGAKG